MTYIIKICQDHHRNRFFLSRDIFQANHDHSYHPQLNHSNHMWSEKLFCLNLYIRFYSISSYKLTSHVSRPHLCLFAGHWKFLDSRHLLNCFSLSNEHNYKAKCFKIRIMRIEISRWSFKTIPKAFFAKQINPCEQSMICFENLPVGLEKSLLL